MRIWSFGGCEYDEEERRLWVRDQAARLGDRVLDVLAALLQSRTHSCSAAELSGIWGPNGSLDSVKDAIRQLRRAIAERGVEEEVLRTVRGWGFALAVPVRERVFEANELWRALRKGEPAPGLPGWVLQMPLELRLRCRVWQIQHETNHQVRVAKYATDASRRSALRREVRVAEALERGLTNQKSFVRVFSAHTSTRPCYVESEYGGLNLVAWSEAERNHGGLGRDTCLAVMAQLAEAVGAAHTLGILHNDLKPANILISPAQTPGLQWQVKIADFGVASVTRENRLAELHLGDRTLQPGDAGVGGTSLYHAPEVRRGVAPTPAADVYALGVILFQLLCGDFQKTPYPGWQEQIPDPALQQDIASACNVDPARRPTASDLAASVRTVDTRLAAMAAEAEVRRRSEQDRAQLVLMRARRPWVAALVAVLLAGAATSLWLYHRAVQQRDLAEAVNAFLSEDFLTRASPYTSGLRTEPLVDVIKGASSRIDQRFSRQPATAARLHQTIANALDKRMDYPDADQEYAAAAALYARIEGRLSVHAAIAQLQRSAMHAREVTPSSQKEAQSLLEQEQSVLRLSADQSPELIVWSAYARGLIAMYGDQEASAASIFAEGVRVAQAQPHFNVGVLLLMQQVLAVAETRSGQGEKAEALIGTMMETVQRLHYTDKPNLANLQLNLAQAYLSEEKNQEAIDTVNQVYPVIVKQMGEDNPLTNVGLGVRAQAEGNLGLWEAAARDDAEVHRLAGGKDLFTNVGSLSDGAIALCRAGHVAAGEQAAHEAMQKGQALLTVNAGVRSSLFFSLSTCLGKGKNYSEAERMLRQVDPALLAQEYGEADWSADYELSEAELALERNDRAGAERYLLQAKEVCTRPTASPFRKDWFERVGHRLDHAHAGSPSS